MKNFLTFFLVSLFLIIGVLGFSENITLQLKWFHQFQFAGFYAAKEMGFYSEEGLDVSIIQGGPTVSPLKNVLTGKVDFGLEGANIIQTKAAGKKIKAIMVIFQEEPVSFMSLKSSGIKTPQDFKGKILGSAGFSYLESQLLLKKAGLSKKDVTFKRWTFNMDSFYKGEFDVIPVYITNEPNLARLAGFEVNVIKPSDYNIHFFGDTLFVSESYLNSHPDIVKKFVKATYKGWLYAINNKEKIVDIILNKYNTQKLSKDHLLYEATEVIKLVKSGLKSEKLIGTFNRNVWNEVNETMYEYKVSRKKIDINDLIYDEFINNVAK
ncbi:MULTISPECIES: ABC transporter substrate-binding protein [unclassified Marinitoga]|uniref:ABC transporter substrate-binding protein n=1 Tax=unclassified Marinitoga TaxID=2640159 RepID=UPI000640F7F1|nr:MULTISPECIES: ABC transporter substrate-binding protein [unclassified Marinitoga]KLO23134.1 hypothetical protein X274_06790 [Marinitoga sp. 1155]NUU99975.1 hypothetical protein [Marinitoga sp. 1154]